MQIVDLRSLAHVDGPAVMLGEIVGYLARGSVGFLVIAGAEVPAE